MNTLGDTDFLPWNGLIGGLEPDEGELLVATARHAGLARLAPELLSADELNRGRQFHVPADRDRFFAAHALKRRLLGALLDIQGSQLRFEQQDEGKPKLMGNGLHFNLSHSGDWVALAVSATAPVGIDVEQGDTTPPEELLSVVLHPYDQFSPKPFSPTEHFYTAWTLKEAVSKGLGMGLALPFVQLRLEPTAPARYQCSYGGESWHAGHRRLEHGAHLAFACRSPWKKIRLLRVGSAD
ncbi:MAG TPA: 4'-phosphopantetheinyl transferase superfamily protein [Chromatiaceae bacterium]|nr:4'-phosphopantetheinyl transferase superfamily protein [Chromatiaceae bacterium]